MEPQILVDIPTIRVDRRVALALFHRSGCAKDFISSRKKSREIALTSFNGLEADGRWKFKVSDFGTFFLGETGKFLVEQKGSQ